MSATKEDLGYFAALVSIASAGWPDIEKVKEVAGQVAFLAEIGLERISPVVKNYPPVQRAIVATLYVTVSSDGVKHMGKDAMLRLFQCARGFAEHSGEMPFFQTMGKAFKIL